MRKLTALIAIFLIVGLVSAAHANEEEKLGKIELEVDRGRVHGTEEWTTTVNYEGSGGYLRVFVPRTLPAPVITRGDCTVAYNGTARSVGCPVVDGKAQVRFTTHMDRFAVQALGFDWTRTFTMRAELYETQTGVCYWCRFPKGLSSASRTVTVSGPASPPTPAVPPTTAAPVTTTAAPVTTTTAVPVTTTAAPVTTTTAAPVSTTAAPVTTTTAVPVTTTAAPVTTTAAPVTTTAAPPTTPPPTSPPTTTPPTTTPPTTTPPPTTTQAPGERLVEASFDSQHVSLEVSGSATVVIDVITQSHPLGPRLVAVDGDATCNQRSRYSRGRRYRKEVTCLSVSGHIKLTFDMYPLDRASVSVDGVITEL